ncbi:MAG: hypothetical protein ACR2HR_11645 [Euzebya sp.]
MATLRGLVAAMAALAVLATACSAGSGTDAASGDPTPSSGEQAEVSAQSMTGGERPQASLELVADDRGLSSVPQSDDAAASGVVCDAGQRFAAAFLALVNSTSNDVAEVTAIARELQMSATDLAAVLSQAPDIPEATAKRASALERTITTVIDFAVDAEFSSDALDAAPAEVQAAQNALSADSIELLQVLAADCPGIQIDAPMTFEPGSPPAAPEPGATQPPTDLPAMPADAGAQPDQTAFCGFINDYVQATIAFDQGDGSIGMLLVELQLILLDALEVAAPEDVVIIFSLILYLSELAEAVGQPDPEAAIAAVQADYDAELTTFQDQIVPACT